MDTLRLLDTFSGIGGFSLAARWVGGFETVQFVEREPYCQRILAKHWPNLPIHDDICTYQPERGTADVVCGGFPCQDISTAGKQAGIKIGTRSGLFYELMRVIRMVEPRYVVLENVSAIVNGGLDIVLGELAEAGFNAEWACIPASAVGACHRRDRWWLVAYASGSDQPRRAEGAGRRGGGAADAGGCGISKMHRGADSNAYRPGRDSRAADAIGLCGERRRATGNMAGAAGESEADGKEWQRDGDAADDCSTDAPNASHMLSNGGTVGHGGECRPQAVSELRDGGSATATHPHCQRQQERDASASRKELGQPAWRNTPGRLNPDWRTYVSEPVLRGRNDGIPNRVARLKALGNAVVPQVAMIPLQRVLDLARGSA